MRLFAAALEVEPVALALVVTLTSVSADAVPDVDVCVADSSFEAVTSVPVEPELAFVPVAAAAVPEPDAVEHSTESGMVVTPAGVQIDFANSMVSEEGESGGPNVTLKLEPTLLVVLAASICDAAGDAINET